MLLIGAIHQKELEMKMVILCFIKQSMRDVVNENIVDNNVLNTMYTVNDFDNSKSDKSFDCHDTTTTQSYHDHSTSNYDSSVSSCDF